MNEEEYLEYRRKKNVIKVVNSAEIMALNARIEPKIIQNRIEGRAPLSLVKNVCGNSLSRKRSRNVR